MSSDFTCSGTMLLKDDPKVHNVLQYLQEEFKKDCCTSPDYYFSLEVHTELKGDNILASIDFNADAQPSGTLAALEDEIRELDSYVVDGGHFQCTVDQEPYDFSIGLPELQKQVLSREALEQIYELLPNMMYTETLKLKEQVDGMIAMWEDPSMKQERDN